MSKEPKHQPLTEAESKSIEALKAAVKALPRTLYVQVDEDIDTGKMCMIVSKRSSEPWCAREVASFPCRRFAG